MIAIYGLVDPAEPTLVRYVGQSSNPSARLAQHCRVDARDQSARARWIRDLLERGRRPSVIILESAQDWRAANERERALIGRYADSGLLVNTRVNPLQREAPEGELTTSGGVNLHRMRRQFRKEVATQRYSASRK